MNGLFEPGELCLGEASLFKPVNPVHKIAAADVDGNDHLDLITAETNDAEARFYFGNGAGAFGGGSGDAFSPVVLDVAVGYFNDDDRPDVVFGLDSDDPNIGIILGDGAGVFPWNFPKYGAVAAGVAVATGDLNGDGYDDVVAVGSIMPSAAQDGRVLVFFSTPNGFGGFGQPVVNQKNDGTYTDVIVSDWNDNGVLDVAYSIIGTSGSWIHACRGNNSGSFSPQACEILPGGDDPRALAAGDFDGDGNVDIAASQSSNEAVLVYFGNGTGAFADPVTVATADTTWGLAAGDVDGDGIADLVATHPAPATASVILGHDGRALDVDATLVVGNSGYIPEDVVLADFNEDGALDVVLGMRGTFNGNPGIAIFLSEV